MFIADHLSRASLKATTKTQVFALELETLNSFDSIKVTPERLTQVQKAIAQDKTWLAWEESTSANTSERFLELQRRDFAPQWNFVQKPKSDSP